MDLGSSTSASSSSWMEGVGARASGRPANGLRDVDVVVAVVVVAVGGGGTSAVTRLSLRLDTGGGREPFGR